MTNDVRSKQRFDSYCKSLKLLEECMTDDVSTISDMQQLAAIKAFEMTCEAGCKTLESFLRDEGVPSSEIAGPKTIIRIAFNYKLIGSGENGQAWMDAIKACDKTLQAYDEAVLRKLLDDIHGTFLPAFRALNAELQPYYE